MMKVCIAEELEPCRRGVNGKDAGGRVGVEARLDAERIVEAHSIEEVLREEPAVYLENTEHPGLSLAIFLSHDAAVELANILLDKAAEYRDRLSVVEPKSEGA